MNLEVDVLIATVAAHPKAKNPSGERYVNSNEAPTSIAMNTTAL